MWVLPLTSEETKSLICVPATLSCGSSEGMARARARAVAGLVALLLTLSPVAAYCPPGCRCPWAE